MNKFRFRWERQGDHIHIDVFIGIPGFTFANCGYLIMSPAEFHQFQSIGTGACEEIVEFIEEGK